MAEVVGQNISVSKETPCRGCGSQIRYYQNDIWKETRTDYTGDSSEYKFINCPNCLNPICVG